MQELIILTGLPSSGKSTVANKYWEDNYKVHSFQLLKDVSDENISNVKLRLRLYSDARENLLKGFNVVIDDTNTTSKKRINAIRSILMNTKKDLIELDRSKIKVISELVLCPYNECLDQNKKGRRIPYEEIEFFYTRWQTPISSEGFDTIRLNFTSETKNDVHKTLNFLKSIPQMNRNHKLSIGHHCEKVGDLLIYEELPLHAAGVMHDFGKLFCMKFKDMNGKLTEDAHYYFHENVSSYDSFFYLRNQKVSDEEKLKISQIILYHMLPHVLVTEKSIKRYKERLGTELWENIILLNEADKKARE